MLIDGIERRLQMLGCLRPMPMIHGQQRQLGLAEDGRIAGRGHCLQGGPLREQDRGPVDVAGQQMRLATYAERLVAPFTPRRLLFHRDLIPRIVLVEYLKILFAFHLALYHLKIMKLLPVMVREGKPTRVGAGFFLDAGNVFEHASDIRLTELRFASGVGFRYRSPIGPLRIDWGWKLTSLTDYWSNYNYMAREQRPALWFTIDIALGLVYALIVAFGLDQLFGWLKKRKTKQAATGFKD